MHAEKWAPLATLLVVLCLLEFGPAIALLSFLGLEVLVAEVVLVPAVAGGFGVSLWAFVSDRRYHRNRGPTRLAWVAAALVLGGYWAAPILAWTGTVLLAGAAAWNLVLVARLSERRARAREAGRKV